MAKVLPKEILAVWDEPRSDAPWLHAGEKVEDLVIDVGEKMVIGRYKLVETFGVEAVIKESKREADSKDNCKQEENH